MAKKPGKAQPAKPDAGYPSSLRVPADMKKALEEAAAKRGRSLAAEMLHRLGNSIEDDERFGDAESQMFGRIVGSTIAFEAKLIAERKRKAGDKLGHAEWWREDQDRAAMREKILGAIEHQLGKSDRRIELPDDVEKQVREWLKAAPDTQPRPDYREAVLQLVVAGLETDPTRKPHSDK